MDQFYRDDNFAGGCTDPSLGPAKFSAKRGESVRARDRPAAIYTDFKEGFGNLALHDARF
jgi:hypothetical protein